MSIERRIFDAAIGLLSIFLALGFLAWWPVR